MYKVKANKAQMDMNAGRSILVVKPLFLMEMMLRKDIIKVKMEAAINLMPVAKRLIYYTEYSNNEKNKDIIAFAKEDTVNVSSTVERY